MTPTTSSSSVHFGLQGRVTIVTGGAQGIGEACARRYARGKALAKELGGTYVHCDVGDKADVDAVIAAAPASYVTGEIVYVDGGRMTLNYTLPV